MARGDTPDGLPPTPDFDSYPVPAAIAAAAREAEGRVLRLDWSDGRTSRYHAIWLRDNATDAGNLNLETREQRGDLTAIPEAIAIAAPEVARASKPPIRVMRNALKMRLRSRRWRGIVRAHSRR